MVTTATQDTDYSSEEDSVFLTQRVHEKRAKSSMPKTLKKVCSVPEETDSSQFAHTQSTKDLVAWASRLELESITLKETVQEDFVDLVKQHQSETSRSLLELEKRIERMAGKLDKSEARIANKMRDVLETSMGPLEEEQVSLNKKVLQINRQLVLMSNNLDGMSRVLDERCKQIEGSLAALDTTYSTGKEVAEIREFLRLLLPRIIGIERSCLAVAQYMELSDEDPSKRRRRQ